ncbi:aspartic peptidase domain-containing protein [Mycena rosella]|uniref:Aspartic peptidase domain-containing protein n=1 Tax=Mycena rosella TaxID=1033263 RepID=A0AAD7GM88_MYCRO|nr:aspartic peptidase domain-containing protein [Mycena rosella]
MWSRQAKGKGRAAAVPFDAPIPPRTLRGRDLEGAGGSDGIVLPLEYVADGPYDISYALPILVGGGSSPQNLSLQIDTGSSDLWIASSSCHSSVCDQAPRYDPSGAVATNRDFDIQYLVGDVFGPIYWDTVTVGGYSVSNQALAAADVIDSEPLAAQFSGVLGLALPANSKIAEEITPQVGDTPDGAVWMSNLFSITPVSSAPSARFLSIALGRPGSDTVPSVLGIGRHPAALVPDPSQVGYDTLYQPSNIGPMFWKTAVRHITVYTATSRMDIPLPRSASGGVFPSAVLDTGVPVILTTKVVADAIYGAIGVQAASDNMYYLPCTTPLNMTFSLDMRDEIALHPLDMTTQPPSTSPMPNSCVGIIQTTADATLSSPTSGIGDMILGVPFLRNVYTVLAYDTPAANGTFPLPPALPTTTGPTTPLSTEIRPNLGLMGLTDPTVALDEFHRVRVLNQPLGDASGPPAPTSGSPKPNVGIDVLIGLASFVGLCVLLFGLRWVLARRSLRRGADGELSARDAKSSRELALALGGYQLARRGGGDADDGLPSEDTLRARRYEAYRQSLHTVSTDRTQVEPSGDDGGGHGYVKEGYTKEGPAQEPLQYDLMPRSPRDDAALLPEHSPERARHSRVLSVNLPLLPDAAVAEDEPPPTSMAGVGTARHSAAFVPPARERPPLGAAS